jgi:hypothetical protein
LRFALQLSYLFLLFALAYIGAYWTELSNGLVAKGGQFRCAELQTTGGDVDALVFFCVLFVLPLALRLVRITRIFNMFDLVLMLFVTTFVAFFLWLASLACANLWHTAFLVPEPALQFLLLGLPLCCFIGFKLYLFDKAN